MIKIINLINVLLNIVLCVLVRLMVLLKDCLILLLNTFVKTIEEIELIVKIESY